MRRFVFIKTRFEALHYYAEAPNEVVFLKYPHRHVFHVEVKIEVFHNEREIEFIMLKRFVDSKILADWKTKEDGSDSEGLPFSCETIAEVIIKKITDRFFMDDNTPRSIVVTVSEDDENGAIVTDIINGDLEK